MNFGMLKNMVENLVASYKCPFCGGKNMSEKHIDIVGAAGNTVNIDMHCPSCNKHFMAKTEMIQMEFGNLHPEKLAQIQKALTALKGKLGGTLEIDIQKSLPYQQDILIDQQIRNLQKSLQVLGFTAEDLFSQDIKND